LSVADGVYYIEDMQRQRLGPADVERLIIQTAQTDGYEVTIGVEQEPGASGKSMAANYVRLLAGWNVKPAPASGDKVTRALPWLAQAEAGNVRLVRGAWNEAFLDEVSFFPVGPHDDMIDAVSGAFSLLSNSLSWLLW